MTCKVLLPLVCLVISSGLHAAPQQPAVNDRNSRDLSIDKDVKPGTIPDQAVPPVSIPRSYALIVGIGKYRSSEVTPLQYSERDAEAIYSVLISPEGGNFRAENVRKLVGAKATLANIRHELETWLPSVTTEQDRVLVYFAGHGFIAGGKAYLGPWDLDPANIAGTAYAMDQLGSVYSQSVKGKWKVLLTDACHSGAITLDSEVRAMNSSLQDLSRSLFSLTASRDRERSYEGADWGGGHGIFTYYVVKGLEGAADENRDGIVTADELAEYTRRNVREATGNQQTPTSERGSYDPQMLLAYVASNVSPAAPPQARFGTLVFETNMDGVEVFVDGKSAGTVNKSTPLTLPGLTPGVHVVKGVKLGYEPDGPREETVYPGQQTTISLRILIQRRRSRAASEHFDKGLEFYTRGFAHNYKQAAAAFHEALAVEPSFSKAALYLGRTYNALFDETAAEKYYRLAIEIDPDYLEARTSFAGMLLDTGNLDEAVRQLDFVTRRDARNAMSWYLLAQVLCRKESFNESIEAAHNAIRLSPNNAEAHFWLAESLRMSKQWQEGAAEYANYLRLSNFDSGAVGKLNYYALGYLVGLGKKRRASQQDIWHDLRSWAYFGLCNCQSRMGQFDAAILNCQKSLRYDAGDPLTHYQLGLAYAYKARNSGDIESAAAARHHFTRMLELNPDLNEAQFAKQNLASINAALQSR